MGRKKDGEESLRETARKVVRKHILTVVDRRIQQKAKDHYGFTELFREANKNRSPDELFSAQPFREALLQLDANGLGLIDYAYGGSITIRRPDSIIGDSIFEIRKCLEVPIAIAVAKLEDKSDAKKKLDAIQKKLAGLKTKIEGKPLDPNSPTDTQLIEQFWDLDTEFHNELANAAGWDLAGIVITLLRDRLRLYGSRHAAIVKRTEETWNAHDKILKAVFAKKVDEVRIRKAVEDHIGTRERWEELLGVKKKA